MRASIFIPRFCLSLTLCLGTVASLGRSLLNAPVAIAESNRNINLTIEFNPKNEYLVFLKKAEAIAGNVVQKAFNNDILLNEIHLVVLAEAAPVVVPAMELNVTRSQWQKYPDAKLWMQYYPEAVTILPTYEPPAPPPVVTSPAVNPSVPGNLVSPPGTVPTLPGAVPGVGVPSATTTGDPNAIAGQGTTTTSGNSTTGATTTGTNTTGTTASGTTTGTTNTTGATTTGTTTQSSSKGTGPLNIIRRARSINPNTTSDQVNAAESQMTQ